MALMSLRSRSHVKASTVLMRDDNCFKYGYIRSLLNIMLRPIVFVRAGIYQCSTVCVSDALAK